MSSIPMHASCHGNRSGEAFLKDPVKHLECAGLRERKRARDERVSVMCCGQLSSVSSGCLEVVLRGNRLFLSSSSSSQLGARKLYSS